jgi:acetyl esterase/lipase
MTPPTVSVGVWGESAGAYVAAMVGVTSGIERFDIGADLDQSSAVQAVVDMFGNSDLAAHAADFDEATQEFFRRADNSVAWYVYGMGSGTTFADDPDGAFRADPRTYVDSSTPPFVVFLGHQESGLPWSSRQTMGYLIAFLREHLRERA